MSTTNVVRAGKRGNICVRNNASATLCLRLPPPLNCVGERREKGSPGLDGKAHNTTRTVLLQEGMAGNER